MEKDCVVQEFDSKSDFGENLNWSKTAKWHFSRLQLGRHEADGLVEAEKQSLVLQLPPEEQALLTNPETPRVQRATIMKPIIENAVDTIFQRAWGTETLRPLQYIVNKKVNTIVTVATRNHSIIPSDEIGQTVETTLQELGYDIRSHWENIKGVLATNTTLHTPLGEIRAGLSIGYGNWITTRAISAGYFFEIEVCTNPLTFLGLSNTMGSKIGLNIAKILRLGDPANILNKTKALVSQVIGEFKTDTLPEIMLSNGQREMNVTDARAVITAMGNAYTIGVKVQSEVIDQYQNRTQNIWELAMILSKISKDTDNFRKDAVKTPAKLSAIALVLLTTTELPKVVTNSYTYCNAHNLKL